MCWTSVSLNPGQGRGGRQLTEEASLAPPPWSRKHLGRSPNSHDCQERFPGVCIRWSVGTRTTGMSTGRARRKRASKAAPPTVSHRRAQRRDLDARCSMSSLWLKCSCRCRCSFGGRLDGWVCTVSMEFAMIARGMSCRSWSEVGTPGWLGGWMCLVSWFSLFFFVSDAFDASNVRRR